MGEALAGWSSLEAIADAVRSCTRCELSGARQNAVPGAGSSEAAVLFVGEGPGQTEDEQGLPFVGRAGKLLDSLLAEVPLNRDDVFITNVVKCRPPGNRDPGPDEVAACLPYLEAQIDLIDPRVIVTLGRHSLLRFYPQGKISADHGRLISLGKRILLPVYHPAAALRNPRLNEVLKQDMRRIPEAVRESVLLRGHGSTGSSTGPASAAPPSAGSEEPVAREATGGSQRESQNGSGTPLEEEGSRDNDEQMTLF